MTVMDEADVARCLELANSLRKDLNLRSRCSAIEDIQRWMLTAFAEGYRRGFWARNERDELNKEQYDD